MAGLLSLACPRESNQREGHPAWRLPSLQLGKSVRGGRAFRQGSCPDEKGSASCRSPCGPVRPPLTAAQGPQKSNAEPKARAARCAAHRSWLFALAVVCALGSWLLALGSWPFGPLWRGGWVEGKPEGWLAGMPASLSSGQEALSTNLRNPPAYLEGAARKARHRGGLSLGYFSLATQREVTRPPAGGRKPAAGEPGRANARTEREKQHSQRNRKHPPFTPCSGLTPTLSPKGRGS
jgi:hypothetical protein